MKTLFENLSIIILLTFYLNSYAQVGIGTLDPNSHSMLHISSDGKGLLIPKVDVLLDVNTLSINENSLLFFHSVDTINRFKYYDGIHNTWRAVSPFSYIGSTNNITTDLNANVTIKGNATITNNIQTTDGEFIGKGIMPIGSIVMWSGSFANFDSDGKGIVGTDMEGWALCVGGSYNDFQGTPQNIPDLRGRFIVGAINNVPAPAAPVTDDTNLDFIYAGHHNPNYSMNTTTSVKGSGRPWIMLSEAETPVASHTHSHTISAATSGNDGQHTHPIENASNVVRRDEHFDALGGPSSSEDTPDGDHPPYLSIPDNTGAHGYQIIISGGIGNRQGAALPVAHSNLPPFMALAYIIKVE